MVLEKLMDRGEQAIQKVTGNRTQTSRSANQTKTKRN